MGMYKVMQESIATGEYIIKDETITLEKKEKLMDTLVKEFNNVQAITNKNWLEAQEEWE